MTAPINTWSNHAISNGTGSLSITVAPAASSQLVVIFFEEGAGFPFGQSFSITDNGTGGSINVYIQGYFAALSTQSNCAGSAILANPTRTGAPTSITINIGGVTSFSGYVFVHEYSAGTFSTTQPNQDGINSGTSIGTLTATNGGADTGSTPCAVYCSISVTQAGNSTLADPVDGGTYTRILLQPDGTSDTAGSIAYRINASSGGTDDAKWTWSPSNNAAGGIASYTLAAAPSGISTAWWKA